MIWMQRHSACAYSFVLRYARHLILTDLISESLVGVSLGLWWRHMTASLPPRWSMYDGIVERPTRTKRPSTRLVSRL
jgi:hypothetical protein